MDSLILFFFWAFMGLLLSEFCVTVQGKLDDSAFKVLVDYQGATVTLLALMSAATGNVSFHFDTSCYFIFSVDIFVGCTLCFAMHVH